MIFQCQTWEIPFRLKRIFVLAMKGIYLSYMTMA